MLCAAQRLITTPSFRFSRTLHGPPMTSATASPFELLPFELHAAITAFLSVRSCAALSQTCRRLRPPYQTALYRTTCVTAARYPYYDEATAGRAAQVPLAAALRPDRHAWFASACVVHLRFDEQAADYVLRIEELRRRHGGSEHYRGPALDSRFYTALETLAAMFHKATRHYLAIFTADAVIVDKLRAAFFDFGGMYQDHGNSRRLGRPLCWCPASSIASLSLGFRDTRRLFLEFPFGFPNLTHLAINFCDVWSPGAWARINKLPQLKKLAIRLYTTLHLVRDPNGATVTSCDLTILSAITIPIEDCLLCVMSDSALCVLTPERRINTHAANTPRVPIPLFTRVRMFAYGQDPLGIFSRYVFPRVASAFVDFESRASYGFGADVAAFPALACVTLELSRLDPDVQCVHNAVAYMRAVARACRVRRLKLKYSFGAGAANAPLDPVFDLISSSREQRLPPEHTYRAKLDAAWAAVFRAHCCADDHPPALAPEIASAQARVARHARAYLQGAVSGPSAYPLPVVPGVSQALFRLAAFEHLLRAVEKSFRSLQYLAVEMHGSPHRSPTLYRLATARAQDVDSAAARWTPIRTLRQVLLVYTGLPTASLDSRLGFFATETAAGPAYAVPCRLRTFDARTGRRGAACFDLLHQEAHKSGDKQTKADAGGRRVVPKEVYSTGVLQEEWESGVLFRGHGFTDERFAGWIE